MSKREFHFSEGTSNKFWAISLFKNSYTVTYGRIGTVGQAKTKELATSEEAQKAHDTLIQTKLREGYTEVLASPLNTASLPLQTTSQAAQVSPPAPVAVKSASAPKEAKPTVAALTTVVAPSPVESMPIQEIPLTLTRAINLAEDDWRWANWRKIPPRQRPQPQPFDREKAVKQLLKIKINHYGWIWDWAALAIPETMTRQEAHFWFSAMTVVRSNKMDAQQLLAQLGTTTFDGQLALEQVENALQMAGRMVAAEVMLPLVNLFSITELFELIFGIVSIRGQGVVAYNNPIQYSEALINGFRKYLLPYLSEAELDIARRSLQPYLAPANWPTGNYEIPYVFLLAARVGKLPELKALVESWPDNAYAPQGGWVPDFYHRPQELILGLEDPQLVEYHMRRLKLRLHKSSYIKGWLAHTEYGAFDLIRDSIQGETNAERAAILLKAFSLVVAPEVAPFMLELKLNSRAPTVARDWLDQHPAEAVAGLIPNATGRGKLAEAALDFLRVMKRKGYEKLISAQLDQLGPEAAKNLRTEIFDNEWEKIPELDAQTTPDWLKMALALPGKKGKLPTWAVAATLPPLLIGQTRLNQEQVEQVLMALQQSTLEKPLPLVVALKQHANPVALDAFGWALFQTWLSEGAPSKEKWAFSTVGLLGGDASALKLTPLIRAWPGESQHQRAVLGLECLRAIGSDTALMQINGIATRVQFKGLKAKAMECMDQIAQTRGLTRAQLEDRIVPDCGLDERGSTVLDFGPRQFYLALGPDLTPVVRDESRKIKNDLPKPSSSDNLALANEAIARWKLLKKQVKEVTKIQAFRLEQAMITGRHWTPAEFEMLFVHHPLMTHLARLLVWGGYDHSGKLTATFRVTEDLEYADQNDDTFSLAGLAEVGIVHPAHLSEADSAAWGQLFADYQLIGPFTQLGRTVYSLEGAEPEQKEITRYSQIKVPAISLVGMLDKMGWDRGIPQDAGVFYEHSKPFYGANVTAVVEYQGVPIGYMDGWDEQSIEKCFFVPGIYTPKMYPDHKNAMLLKDVDQVVISEVLRNLHAIASKGK